MKKRWRRKLLAGVLAAALGLSGCAEPGTGSPDGAQGTSGEGTHESDTPQSKTPEDASRGQSRQEPEVLVYGTMGADVSVEAGIGFWNQLQQEYRVEVKSYENSDAGLMQLNADIVAGKGPDLFDLSDVNVAVYAANGILADLYPYMSEELREQLTPGVMKTYEIRGELYGLPLGYRFETLMGKRELVGDAADWTVDKMLELTEGLGQDQILMDALSPEGFLRAALAADTNSYVDWEAGECHFDGEKFRGLLETAASLKVNYLEDDEKKVRLADGSLLLERTYVSDLSEYRSCAELFGADQLSWLGFPSEQGGKTVLYARMPIGISELSEKKEGAWKFISYLLEEEFQRKYVMFNFPIRLSVLKERLKTEDGSGEQLLDIICGLNCEDVSNMDLQKIVMEEAQFYFDNRKPLDEVVRIIQNRAANYVAENRRSR